MTLVQVTIDSLIGNSAMKYRKCIGFKLTGDPCTSANALKDVVEASEYTEAASLLHCSTSEGRTDPEWLAALLLCKNNHQKHSYEVMEIWHSQAKQCLATKKDNTARTKKGEEKHTPPSKDMPSIQNAGSDQKPEDLSDGDEGVRKVRTNVQTRSMTARAARKTSKDSEVDTESRNVSECRERLEKVKTNVKTRSMTSQTPQTRSEKLENQPEFIEHPKSKRQLSAVNAELMKHILNESRSKPNRRLTERDLESGYIYAFTRLSSPGYVKIGLSTRTVEVRLKEWERQCKYSPYQETPKYGRWAPFVAQVERLIHAELSLHRRKESVCNGGAGCPKVHHEWVEVDVELALEVIDRWCSWAEMRPYHENGVLRDEWEAHTRVPVRHASRNEREQGNRWQEWIDSFPTTSPPSSTNGPSANKSKSETQLAALHTPKTEKGPKYSKLGLSVLEVQALVRPLAAKPRTAQIPSARPLFVIDSMACARSVALVAA